MRLQWVVEEWKGTCCFGCLRDDTQPKHTVGHMHYEKLHEGSVLVHGYLPDPWTVPYGEVRRVKFNPLCMEWARRRSIYNSMEVIVHSFESKGVTFYPMHIRTRFLKDVSQWIDRREVTRKAMEKEARYVARVTIRELYGKQQ